MSSGNKNLYLFLCYDFYTGKQDIVFYGEGVTMQRAQMDACIPINCEVVEVFNLDEDD